MSYAIVISKLRELIKQYPRVNVDGDNCINKAKTLVRALHNQHHVMNVVLAEVCGVSAKTMGEFRRNGVNRQLSMYIVNRLKLIIDMTYRSITETGS